MNGPVYHLAQWPGNDFRTHCRAYRCRNRNFEAKFPLFGFKEFSCLTGYSLHNILKQAMKSTWVIVLILFKMKLVCDSIVSIRFKNKKPFAKSKTKDRA